MAVYTGDDERFKYFYKFVSTGRHRRWDRKHGLGLLDKGTLWPGGGDSLPRPAVTSIWRSAEGDPTIGQ